MALEASPRIATRLPRFTRRRHANGIWHPIPTSKRVLMDGHVLRAHHEATQRLQLFAANLNRQTRSLRAFVPQLRKLIRHDDLITVARHRITVTMRADTWRARTAA